MRLLYCGMEIRSLSETEIQALSAIRRTNTGKIALPVKNGLIFIPIDQILYSRSDGNYCRVFAFSGQRYHINKPLNALESQLSPLGFIRIHHQYLVNVQHVLRYEKGDGGTLVLTDQTILPVSRERKRGFLGWVEKMNGATDSHGARGVHGGNMKQSCKGIPQSSK